MLSTVLGTIAAHRLFEPGDRVIVAVSGGPDSMALLAVLWEARARLGLTLEVAGVDHGLRPAAAEELALVRARAEALGIPFHSLAVDVAANKRGASLQDAARRLRLGVLAALATERGACRIALGHQADDQAETVLFRIVRGTGLVGLSGIPYQRELAAETAAGAPVTLVRPLLDVRRAEIFRYLRRRSLPFVEDPSNANLRFARARARHRLLPLLREENPRVVEALIALAEAARAGGARPPSAPCGRPPAEAALPRRVASAVRRLRTRGGTASLDVAGQNQVEVAYGRVQVRPRAPVSGRASTAPAELVISEPGSYPWAGGTLDVTEVAGRLASGGAEFDADQLDRPLTVRVRRTGDRMRPRGGQGSRKLSDLMIDAKIARGARALLPVVTSARGELLYVPGLRPAQEARPTSDTRVVIRLGFRPLAAHLSSKI